MMSFVIFGIVIGVSYIMVFNLLLFEMIGFVVILIVCFVFCNMLVGVCGGIVVMIQFDKSLDEVLLILCVDSFRIICKVVLFLLWFVIMVVLVYFFVWVIIFISVVIFLVSVQYNMVIFYIVGFVENGEYGVVIVYSFMLIVVMIVVIVGFQFFVGECCLCCENCVVGLVCFVFNILCEEKIV